MIYQQWATVDRVSYTAPYASGTFNERLVTQKAYGIYVFDTLQQSWIIDPYAIPLESEIVVQNVCSYENIWTQTPWSGNSAIVTNLIYFKKGTETWGNPRIVVGLQPTLASNDEVSIFPNPANHVLNLKHSNKLIFKQIEIIDLKGRVVLEKDYNSIIDLNSLKEGLYFLRLTGDKNTITTKFIKE